MLNKMLNPTEAAEPVLKFKRGDIDDLSGVYGDMYKFAYYSTNDNTVYLCINGFDFPETVNKFEKAEILKAQGYILKMHDLERDYDIVFVEKIIKGRKFVALVRMRNHSYYNSRFIFVFEMAEFLSKINSLVVKDNNRTIGKLYFPALNDSRLLPKVENLTENIPLSPLLKTTIKKIEDAYKSKPNNNQIRFASSNSASILPPNDVYNQSYGDFKYKIIDNSDNNSATSDFEHNSQEQNTIELFGESFNIKPDLKPVAIKPISKKLSSVKSKKKESDINTADILTVANMRSDNDLQDPSNTNSSININSIEASPIQLISPNASNMSFQSNRKTRMSSDLLSTQHSQLNTSAQYSQQANSSSSSRFKPPNLFKD